MTGPSVVKVAEKSIPDRPANLSRCDNDKSAPHPNRARAADENRFAAFGGAHTGRFTYYVTHSPRLLFSSCRNCVLPLMQFDDHRGTNNGPGKTFWGRT